MGEETHELAARSGGRRPPWSAFRTALERAGFRPTKTRGQNFLIDPNVHAAIVRDAELPERARVLEVGCGCGFLSCHLAEEGHELLLVEIEPRLAAIASAFLRPYPDVRMLVTDALATKHALAPELAAVLAGWGEYHLVANLPYGIAGPLVATLARGATPPASMTVLVQREVAERIGARPGEPAWGALSARLALDYESRPGRPVGAQLFWPRPRVESALVHLRRRPEPSDPALRAPYERLVEGLFRHRRRQLPGALEGVLGSKQAAGELLERLGIDPRQRPGDLGREVLLRLAEKLP